MDGRGREVGPRAASRDEGGPALECWADGWSMRWWRGKSCSTPFVDAAASGLPLFLPGRAPGSAIDWLGSIAHGRLILAAKRSAIPLARDPGAQGRAFGVEVVYQFEFPVL